MKLSTLGTALALSASLFAAPVFAGNIVLTGHDNDFHENAGSAASDAAFMAEINFVRNGSGLKVLTFDAGSELTNVLTATLVEYVTCAHAGLAVEIVVLLVVTSRANVARLFAAG